MKRSLCLLLISFSVLLAPGCGDEADLAFEGPTAEMADLNYGSEPATETRADQTGTAACMCEGVWDCDLNQIDIPIGHVIECKGEEDQVCCPVGEGNNQKCIMVYGNECL